MAKRIRDPKIRKLAEQAAKAEKKESSLDWDEVLLPQIDAQIAEGGGWAKISRLPGGENYIWGLIERGILEEEGEFVRRK
jgi:hypothetical protein